MRTSVTDAAFTAVMLKTSGAHSGIQQCHFPYKFPGNIYEVTLYVTPHEREERRETEKIPELHE